MAPAETIAAYRSTNHRQLRIVVLGDLYEVLPVCLLHLGPWQGLGRRPVSELKLPYQRLIADQGFLVIWHANPWLKT